VPWLHSSAAVSFVTAAVAVAVLQLAKPVLAPLAVAVLLCIVIAPTVSRIEGIGVGRWRIGRIAAVLAVVLAVMGAFGGTAWIVGVQGGALVRELPQYRRTAVAQLRAPLDSLRRLERAAREVREMTEAPTREPEPPKVEVVDGDSELVRLLRGWAGSVASLLGTAGLVVVLLFFLLVERESLVDRLLRLLSATDPRVATSALAEAVDCVTRYLRALVLVNLAHGATVALVLLWIGLPGALLFGLLAAILRFVPYLGPWLAASLPIALALASSDGWTLALEVALLFLSLEVVSSNLFEPWLIGTRIGLSPFAMVLSTLFWAWIWGPIGLVLAVPTTACLVAFGRHAPSLEPLAILLGGAPGSEGDVSSGSPGGGRPRPGRSPRTSGCPSR